MNRRRFLAAGALGAQVVGAGAARAREDKPARKKTGAGMVVGCQSGPTTEARLRYFARHGVTHICGELEGRGPGPYTVDELQRLRDLCSKHGVSLDMMELPNMGPTPIDRAPRPAIMLGAPERDRDIDDVNASIRNAARAGVPALKYNLALVGYRRTHTVPGRGGAQYTAWRLRDARALGATPTRAGKIGADVVWERISYFLERVVPVATEHKVRLCCHPHDPPTPPGFQGVDNVLGTVDGLKRFVGIAASPYHGLNFCQGTIAEMLDDPARQILPVIRWFGQRKKIFNVHFRNISGRRDDFVERFPDEGDVDMLAAMRVYKEVGYQYMLMPDHAPKHPDDAGSLQAFAYCYGYMSALLQAVA
jgi:mannonate dehydratase